MSAQGVARTPEKQQQQQQQQALIGASSRSNATIIPLILFTLCVCLLLLPSYYSTDFDVHRNWLAITRHLPLDEWYFDDLQGQTVHTLDYPPMFAYFEAILSNNRITRSLESLGLVDSRCFGRLPDSNNTVSDSCVIFHRSTVIISYAVYVVGSLVGAKVISEASASSSMNHNQKKKKATRAEESLSNTTTIITLLLLNPGLWFLDHVHFQYNGLLLGILLLSLSCIIRAGITHRFAYDIIGSIFFAFLLGMKHLYLPLGPLYFVYLLRHYCFINNGIIVKSNKNNNTSSGDKEQHQQDGQIRFSLLRFISLSSVTLVTLCIPYLPFFILTTSPLNQMKQILSRLFPFSRGLVHDYWAGNVWAIYLFLSKCLRFLSGYYHRYSPAPIGLIASLKDGLPEATPVVSASLSVVSLVPALFCAYKVAGKSLEMRPPQSPFFFVHATAFCSLCFFMLGYHVHEKAIMSAIIPLTLLSTLSRDHARLYLRICVFGHFGLFPLLYRPVETLFKIFAYAMHFSLSVFMLETFHNGNNDRAALLKTGKTTNNSEPLLKGFDKFCLFFIFCLTVYTECIQHMTLNPFRHLDFLPLMVTSVFCAIGLLFCWVSLAQQMWKHSFNREI